jgi:hypothetical protein
MAASAKILPFPGAPSPVGDEAPARSLSKLKKAFRNAVSNKWAENDEARQAERYFHGLQHTNDQLKAYQDRGQPVVTYNRIKRKINTICGIIEKLRQDPKAYPRNPQRQSEDGAEIATKVLNYALGWDWVDISTAVARRCAIRGMSGVELVLVPGDQQDPELAWDLIDQRDFFYDTHSTKPDFSDARFLGTTRWVDLDEAIEKFPAHEEDLTSFVEHSPLVETDRGDERSQMAWTDRERKRVRLVEHWYMVGSSWHYAIYAGEAMLEFGPSYLKDEKGHDTHKYELLSFEVDHDGDRYGAFRDLKSAQDEVNQRRSKALHQLNSRKVIADAGAVDDVEAARREYARSDGWVIKNPGKEIITEDQAAQAVVEGNLNLLQEAKAEIDTYGPNPGLVGTEIPADSGRAIQLLQAAGIAELGAYMQSYRAWKLRVYRKTWCAVQQIWKAPRWVRVTDDENLSQFIQVNGWQQDPQTGMVQVLNQLAALDVDIIIEEGPDTVNTMADTFDTLVALGKGGAQVPPEMFIELSPLPSSTKQRILQSIAAAQQPKPIDQQAMMLQLQLIQAQIQDLQSKAQLNMAKAQEALTPEQGGPGQQIDTAADTAKATLDLAKAHEIEAKIEAGAHLPQPEREQPGLFEVNVAKARESHARADAAESQSWDSHETALADQALKQAQTIKTMHEAQTIAEAPSGMLTKPAPVRKPTSN